MKRKRIATTSTFRMWENDNYTVENEKASKVPLSRRFHGTELVDSTSTKTE